MRWRYQKGGRITFAVLGALSLVVLWWFFLVKPHTVPTLYDVEAPHEAKWIQTNAMDHYTGCFRKDISVAARVENAWIAVSSYGGYELLCNGNPVGAQTLWRPTRIFQNGLTESTQRISQTESIIAYNFPREYQWSGHANDKVVTYYDLTQYLTVGVNSIAIEIESRKSDPSVIAFGQVRLTTGEVVPLNTDSFWRAEPVPKGMLQNDWSSPNVSLANWNYAKTLESSEERNFKTVVPRGAYSSPHPSRWITVNDGKLSRDFSTHFEVNKPKECSIKILTHSPYWLWINGVLIQSHKASKKGYNGAEWMVLWEGRRPLATYPELLDPDESAELFGGERFMNPRHGDPTQNDFKRFENQLNRTKERPNQTGNDLLSDGDEEKGRLSDPYGFYEEAETIKPPSLLRKRAQAQYHSYDISKLLKLGKNRVKIRLLNEQMVGYEGSQSAKFAVSAQADGVTLLNNIDWVVDNEHGQINSTMGAAVSAGELVRLSYQGCGRSEYSRWTGVGVFFIGIVFFFLVGYFPGEELKRVFIVFICSAFGYLLLESSFAERSESLFFAELAQGRGAIVIVSSVAFFVFIAGRLWSKRRKFLSDRNAGWSCAVLLILLFVVRAWNVDHQPIDDDEYASIQAILSIADTGVPQIADDIWYSRSPLYHYAAAVFVKLFGANLLALRIYSVLLAVITGWLIWMIAKRYMHNRFVAIAALLIFTLHPFLIFSGHIARFYQQQQMFVVLMLHLFIQGFIHGKSIWYRAGSILVFALATLSQEISISFVPVFMVLYLLFGRGVKVSWDIKAILYIVFAGLLVFADVALFKVKCLTRVTGVSPNVEATLAPTFWELGNLASMFVGYARLHLVLSAFYIISLVYSFRRGGRKLITLHLTLLISIISFNLIITSVSFRYMYSLIPLWILLGCHGMYVLSHWLSLRLGKGYQPVIGVSCVIMVLMSFSPWRIVDSYDEKILGDPISALGYVRNELRSTDKIMISEPHPHAAKIELGRVDYDLVVPILYDFTYSKDGVLRDRNGNAEVVNRLAQLQDIFASNERVWIIVNREKFRSRKKNIRWEYPAAREELFLRTNCSLKYRSYLWSVFLWDSNSGKIKTFRGEAKEWVE